jgi:hypothetical protein
MGSAIQLFLFAMILYGVGSWGQRNGHWDFRIFLFAFAIPAGFFFGWSVMQIVFPYYSLMEQLLISGGSSLAIAGVSAVVLRYTKVN